MASIRKRGEKWQVQVRRHDLPPLSRTFTYRSDAIEWAREMERRADRAELPQSTSSIASMSFGDLAERFLCEAASRHRSPTARQVVDTLRCSELWRLPLRSVGPECLAVYRDRRLREVGAGTVLRELGVIGRMFSLATTEWGMPLAGNPMTRISKPKAPNARERRLSAEEEARLFQGCKSSRNRYLRPLIVLALETAMRRGELLRVRRQDLDAASCTLHIPLSKNGHARTIPLSPTALRELLALPVPPDGSLFPLTPVALRLAWDRLLRRAGICDLHFHDLRHEAISRLFERGLSVPEVALVSGHRDVRQLFRYTHLRAEDVARKLARAEAA